MLKPGIALLLSLCGSRLAAADEGSSLGPLARSHLEVGLGHFAAGEYERAIAEFELGHALEPRPEFLYAMAQAERLSGDCASAVVLYRRFLDAAPARKQAEAARQNLERCEEVLAAQVAGPAPPPAPTPAPTAAPPRPPPEPLDLPSSTVRRAWYRDPITLSLIGGGVAFLGVGLGLTAASVSDARAAEDAFTYREYQALLDRAGTRRILGVSGITIGIALVATGVARGWLAPRRAMRLDAWADPSGGGVALTGGF